MKVAVTGVGGGVGQSIMKALTMATLPAEAGSAGKGPLEVCAVDVQAYSAGLYRTDTAAVLPKPELPGAADTWARWIEQNNVDVLIPGSDHELLAFAALRDKWRDKGICRVLVSDLDTVEACQDKTLTCARLESAGLPSPASIWDVSPDEAVSWAKSVGFPVVLKPRSGFASRDLHIVGDEEELRFFLPRTPAAMLQEHLSLDGRVDEYTCAVFVDRDGSPVGTFMARRDLSGGATYRAEVGRWPEIEELLLAIGKALRPMGPINVQLRQTPRGPVPFELNIRCSGTTAIRAYFGYNEPEMLLRHYVLGEELSPPQPRTGYVLRYWNEVFLDGVDAQRLRMGVGSLKGNILPWP